jgi:predicted transcriptional regulator
MKPQIKKNIILSIKPKFVRKIHNKEKRFEYRKKIWRSECKIERIYIYATRPIKQVVGYFKPGIIAIDTPEEIWRKTGFVGGIDHTEYKSYFRNCKEAYAISIEEPYFFEVNMDLESFGVKYAPQGFLYLDSIFGEDKA